MKKPRAKREYVVGPEESRHLVVEDKNLPYGTEIRHVRFTLAEAKKIRAMRLLPSARIYRLVPVHIPPRSRTKGTP